MDLGGQREYLHSHGMFFTPFAVYALFWRCPDLTSVDSAEAVTHRITESVLPYLCTIQARAPHAPVVLVVSQVDRVHGSDVALDTVTKAASAAVQQLRDEDGFPSLIDTPVLTSAKRDGGTADLDTVLVHQGLSLPGVADPRPSSYRALQLAITAEASMGVVGDGTIDSGGAAEETKTEVGDGTTDEGGAPPRFSRPWGPTIPVTTVAEVHRVAVASCGYTGTVDGIRSPLKWLHNLGVVVFGGAQSLLGTIASAFTISQAQSTMEFFLSGSMAKVLTLLTVVGILMLRPEGLFSLKIRR